MNWYIIFLFLLAIILYLYTQYIWLKHKSKTEKIEQFQAYNDMTPIEKLKHNYDLTLTFLTANQVSHQIQSQTHEYIELMNQPNLLARGVNTKQELLEAYSKAFQDITENEKELINKFILELLSKIQYKYPAYYRYLKKWLNTIAIAKSNSSLEAGMPHTLDNIIILDSSWFSNPRATTLLHEITHIHQRQVPFEFEELYSQWGYYQIPIRNIHGMEAIIQLNRNNPDGINPNWLWWDGTKYWWIGAVFSSITPVNLHDINVIAVKMEQDSQGNFYYLKQYPTPLNNFESFLDYFGGDNPNNYHPNEMASKFAEWYLEDALGIPKHNKLSNTNNNSNKSNKKKGYQVYKEYFNKLLETYY